MARAEEARWVLGRRLATAIGVLALALTGLGWLTASPLDASAPSANGLGAAPRLVAAPGSVRADGTRGGAPIPGADLGTGRPQGHAATERPSSSSFLSTGALPAGALRAGALRAGAPRAGAPRARPTASRSPHLALVSEPFVAVPGQPFVLELGGLGSAPPGTTLEVDLFDRLTSRFAFAAALRGSPGPLVATTGPLALGPLLGAGGRVTLTIGLRSGDAPNPTSSSVVLDLHCAPGSCAGVYPLEARVFLPGHTSAESTLMGFLVYERPPPVAEPLRVAVVLPVGLDEPASAARRALGALGTLLTQSHVPLTVALAPAVLAAPALGTHRAEHSAVALLDTLGTNGVDEVAVGPYATVSANALVAVGLGAELGRQLAEGGQAVAEAGIRAVDDVVVARAPLDESAALALARAGARAVVVPASSVVSPSERLTVATPFPLEGVPAGVSGHAALLEADAELASEASGAAASTDPVLAAHVVLADASLVYFEQPNLARPRGVVLELPASSAVSPAFLAALLAGLAANPALQPVTLSDLLASVPEASQPATLLPARAPGASLLVAARTFRRALGEADSLEGALLGQAARTTVIRALLADEAELGVRPRPVPTRFDALLARLRASLHLATDHVTLTARSSKLPVTIESTAPFSLDTVLEVTSDALQFPQGGRMAVVIDRPTTAVAISVRVRSSGVFRVDGRLFTPDGRLLLASSSFTVGTVAPSALALGLTAVALGVLIAWWLRTARGRRPRGPTHGAPGSKRATTTGATRR
jgi:hypothetical protein